ncbi:hypothetical protein ACHAXT_005492 [Thalassiosira profunda]
MSGCTSSRRRRRLLVAASLFCCGGGGGGWSGTPPVAFAAAASTTSTSLDVAGAPPLPASPPPASASASAERPVNQTSSFFDKFESRGPTLTLTLRDPSITTLLGGSDGGGDRKGKLWGNRGSPKPKRPPGPDVETFPLAEKLGAIFHISSSAATTNGQGSAPKSSKFADGFMLDDGEVFLDPPASAAEGGAATSRGLFSIREVGGLISNGGRTLSECAQNVHPELRYEMTTKSEPFPASAPWLSGLSCGMIWSPFPVYKLGYPEGYGHKLLSVPHHLQCGARISLPRISAMVRSWRSTSNGIASDFMVDRRPARKDLDLGVTYRESPYRPGGSLELLLGRSRQTLSPANAKYKGTANDCTLPNNPLLRRKEYEGRNCLLLRLATGKAKGRTDKNPILSSIEYAKASCRLPTPFFLRTKYNDRLSVSPSFDFTNEVARCTFSGDVGSSGRTRAVLRLDSEDESTLTVVRALDDSKTIAPTISLGSGKIVYDYHLNLDAISGKRRESNERKVNSSLRAHVDPTKGILLKWTDGVRGGRAGGSCWVTECRIPLGTQGPGPLAADVRVGRRWDRYCSADPDPQSAIVTAARMSLSSSFSLALMAALCRAASIAANRSERGCRGTYPRTGWPRCLAASLSCFIMTCTLCRDKRGPRDSELLTSSVREAWKWALLLMAELRQHENRERNDDSPPRLRCRISTAVMGASAPALLPAGTWQFASRLESSSPRGAAWGPRNGIEL